VFNVGVPEMIVILLVALLVFGPDRLPEIARNMGKFIRNFQQETNRALSDLKAGIEPATTGIFDEPDPATPADEVIAASAVPAPAFGATTGTRRKMSAWVASGRRKPVSAKTKPAPATAKRKAGAKNATAAKKKPAAKKSSKR